MNALPQTAIWIIGNSLVRVRSRWKSGLSDEEILEKLLALNLERSK